MSKNIDIMSDIISRDRSSAAAISKMERSVIIVNGWKPLTIITKRSNLDVEAALDPPLLMNKTLKGTSKNNSYFVFHQIVYSSFHQCYLLRFGSLQWW